MGVITSKWVTRSTIKTRKKHENTTSKFQ